MLKWIEQSRQVAESIRVNEDLVCRLSPTDGRDWEGQIMSSVTVSDVCVENKVSL